jgi:hypothetical protein
MTPMATLLTPVSWGSPAVELGNRTWTKLILPVGEIDYMGRRLRFTPEYLRGLVEAWHQRAYDQVPLQFADAANAHTNDPERTRGWITDMRAEPDGLYVTAEVTERGERVLRDNPYLGVSARIVEQYQRADGQFFPAAIQHVLATLDPRITGLGAWQSVEMSSDAALIIDLSTAQWAGEPGPDYGGLSDRELAELLDAVAEAEEELGDGGELSDAELDAIMAAAEAGEDDEMGDPFSQFDAAWQGHVAREQARQDARDAATVEDVMHPAKRLEDKLARAVSRAADGVYDGQAQAYGFASEQAAIDLAISTGRGPCGPPDEFGRCGSRYHSLECSHAQSVDWVASGPPRQTFENSLANLGAGLELATPATWGDPDDDEPMYAIPAGTIELAHQLSHDWGLDADMPYLAAPGAGDLLQPPSRPPDLYAELGGSIGLDVPQPPQAPGYPGVRQLAEGLGLR